MLTVLAAELCRMGYVPSQDEIASGYIDPYDNNYEDSGCKGVHANKLWTCQAVISFSTLLLAISVVFRARISLAEKELQVIYAGSHADPPDISMVNRRARRNRALSVYKRCIAN